MLPSRITTALAMYYDRYETSVYYNRYVTHGTGLTASSCLFFSICPMRTRWQGACSAGPLLPFP